MFTDIITLPSASTLVSGITDYSVPFAGMFTNFIIFVVGITLAFFAVRFLIHLFHPANHGM